MINSSGRPYTKKSEPNCRAAADGAPHRSASALLSTSSATGAGVLLPPAAAAPPTAVRLPAIAAATAGRFGTISSRSFAPTVMYTRLNMSILKLSEALLFE